MYHETIGHGAKTYTIEVEKTGVATITHQEDDAPIAWGIPANQWFAHDKVSSVLCTRINTVIANGREVLGRTPIADEETAA